MRFIVDLKGIDWNDLNFVRDQIGQNAHLINLQLFIADMNQALI